MRSTMLAIRIIRPYPVGSGKSAVRTAAFDSLAAATKREIESEVNKGVSPAVIKTKPLKFFISANAVCTA